MKKHDVKVEDVKFDSAENMSGITEEITELFIKHKLSFEDGMLCLFKTAALGLNNTPTAPSQMEFEMGDYIILASKDKSLLPHREKIDQAAEEYLGADKTKH